MQHNPEAEPDTRPLNILITGAGGFLGRHLARMLALEHGVIPITHHDGDIRDVEFPDHGIDHVAHLAARTFVPFSWRHPERFYDTNVQGTLHVLEHCRRMGAGITFLSSYLYGAPDRLPINESAPIRTPNPYAHSKWMGEKLCENYAELHGVPVTIVRLFNPYGPGQPHHFLIPEILRQLLDPHDEDVGVNDLTPRRDYLFISDVVQALVDLVTGGHQGVYNLGSGESHAVGDLIQLAMRVTGIEKAVTTADTPRQNEIPDVVADTTKLRDATGWTPRVGLEEGLAKTAYAIRKELAR